MALGLSSCGDEDRAGIMIPVPVFSQYIARAKEFNLYQVFTDLLMKRFHTHGMRKTGERRFTRVGCSHWSCKRRFLCFLEVSKPLLTLL